MNYKIIFNALMVPEDQMEAFRKELHESLVGMPEYKDSLVVISDVDYLQVEDAPMNGHPFTPFLVDVKTDVTELARRINPVYFRYADTLKIMTKFVNINDKK